MFNSILVRYDEIGLKGKNRNWFEDMLLNNINRSIAAYGSARKFRGRIVILSVKDENMPHLLERLEFIPGISSFSPAIRLDVDASWEDIESASLLLADRAVEQKRTSFRVSCNRSNKKFPIKSPEVQQRLAAFVLRSRDQAFSVSLRDYNFNLEIEIDLDHIFIFMDRVKGLHGLPVGSAGEFLVLLSGGLDSPVAAFKCMKRGAKVNYISFSSPPYTGEESMQKLLDITAHLKRFQGVRAKLFVAPLIDIQLLIRARCFESYRTILFRRMMFKIAEKVADREGYKALVTGESLSQVASQTVENLAAINDAVEFLPVIRPLITNEKNETIEIAKKIGTYEISIRSCADSCTAFLPKDPIIKSKMNIIRQEEEKLQPEIEELIKFAIDNAEVINV